MKIFIVNDREQDLNSIARVLIQAGFREIKKVHQTSTFLLDELTAKLKAENWEILLLMDLEIDSDREGGIKIARRLIESNPNLKIIIMTGTSRNEVMAKVLNEGDLIAGYIEFKELEKDIDSIVDVIKKVQAGKRDILNDHAIKHLIQHYRSLSHKSTPLTQQELKQVEIQFLEMLAQGYTHSTIQKALGNQAERPDRMIEKIAKLLSLEGNNTNISIRLVARSIELGIIDPQKLKL